MSDNKRIAKNTLFLYIRMLLIMGVSLYTARVILDKLGVNDYGIYNVVGGVVGLLSFINGTLATSTSRFITFELGRKDFDRLSRTFSTTFYTHFGLAMILCLLLETIGLWFLCNRLVIPPDRMNAAVVAYHISILTMILSITQVPYTALIIAHEEMGMFAYVSIFEAFAKLAVVYMLAISPFDKLIVYAFLNGIVGFIVISLYRLYCRKKHLESILHLIYDRSIFKSLLGFSSWNVIAFLSEALKYQGYLVLINLFFQPFVVAAQTIGNQVANAMMQFVSSFRKAIEPQIIKKYAIGDYEGSKKLALQSTIFSFDLVLLLGLPSIFVMNTMMSVWLKEVPAYAVVFTQYILLQRILGVFDMCLYTSIIASGRVQSNALSSLLFGIGSFILLYILFKMGYDVMWIQYIVIMNVCIYSFFIKPYILVKEVEGYHYSDFIPCFITCSKIAALSGGISYISFLFLGNDNLPAAVLLFVISFISVLLSSYIFIDISIKKKIKEVVLSRLRQINNHF